MIVMFLCSCFNLENNTVVFLHDIFTKKNRWEIQLLVFLKILRHYLFQDVQNYL